MNLSQLDLNLLVALEALLREQNVTRAGQRIGLSQPAMSSSLSRLRHHFGDDLLVRTGRDYHLTPLARELVEPVQEILRLIDQTMSRRPGFDPAVDERGFRIAVSDYAALIVLDKLLPRIAAAAPNVSLRLIPTGISTRTSVTGGGVDLAIIPEQMGPNLPHQVLYADRWVCAVSADNAEVGETLSMEQFLELQHIVFRPGETENSLADWALGNLGIERKAQVVVNSFLLLPFLMEHTPYVILVYERVARRLFNSVHMRLMEPPFAIPPVSIAMYWPHQSSADPAHQWLREEILAACGDLEAL